MGQYCNRFKHAVSSTDCLCCKHCNKFLDKAGNVRMCPDEIFVRDEEEDPLNNDSCPFPERECCDGCGNWLEEEMICSLEVVFI